MGNPFLVSGAVLSAIAALLHVGCIVFGASWYRFFGAGERLTRMAAIGDWRATLITSGIVLVLTTWSLYGFSGAGLIPKLPLLRTGLGVITGIYLLRGIGGFLIAALNRGSSSAFWWWSSLICLTIGLVHLVGVRQAWPQLSSGAV